MKKSALLICAIIGGYANNCHAVNPIYLSSVDGCYSYPCGAPDEWYVIGSPDYINCATGYYSAACVHYGSLRSVGVASCTSCNPGYELTEVSGGVTACSATYEEAFATGTGAVSSSGHYKYTECVKNCQASNCISDAWKALRTGYESRTYRSCSTTGASGTCNASTQYRCAAGYYGTSTNGTSGCSQCPTWSGVYTDSARTTLVRGTSSADSNTAITGCYVVAGTYYDATGTFKTTGNCQYK